MLECQSGSLVDTCDPFEGAAQNDTTCDGIDNDCDGFVDEEYVITASQCGQGACLSTGQKTCVNGSIIDSCTEGNHTGDDSDCDDIDDDCDGTADEHYVTSTINCGIGVCAATGLLQCQEGVEVEMCTPGTAPENQEITCNDILDNDCDGTSDLNDTDCLSIVNLVWQDSIKEDYDIYFRRSTDGGDTWDDPVKLTNVNGNSRSPAIAVDKTDIYVVWQNGTTGNYDIYFMSTSNSGETWHNMKNLSNNAGKSMIPALSE